MIDVKKAWIAIESNWMDDYEKFVHLIRLYLPHDMYTIKNYNLTKKDDVPAVFLELVYNRDKDDEATFFTTIASKYICKHIDETNILQAIDDIETGCHELNRKIKKYQIEHICKED